MSRKSGSRWTPSMMTLVFSSMQRLMIARTPTLMILACSRKPEITGSSPVALDSETAARAVYEDGWSAGISSGDSIRRMTWRMSSVATTRGMSSRFARLTASEVLPTPLAPPIRMTSGLSNSPQMRHTR